MKRVLGNACWPLLLGSAWFSSRPVPTRLELDNVRVELDLALFEICKVPTPGGFLLAPDASLDSGILHAWHFGKGTIVGFADDLVRGMAGRAGHLGSRRIEYLSRDPRANRSGAAAVRRIAIVPAEPLSVQVNGDYVGSTPAQFEVRPQSLRLVVPAGRRQSKKD
jgi:diacylglycerol kinase family enzyme